MLAPVLLLVEAACAAIADKEDRPGFEESAVLGVLLAATALAAAT
jgi:hypothetical protein